VTLRVTDIWRALISIFIGELRCLGGNDGGLLLLLLLRYLFLLLFVIVVKRAVISVTSHHSPMGAALIAAKISVTRRGIGSNMTPMTLPKFGNKIRVRRCDDVFAP
jgi:hypothetical protein